MYPLKILLNQPYRLVLTAGGIGLCIVLMLFLLGIYEGISEGSVDYIRENKADLWILQENTTNILRGTSILSTMHLYLLQEHTELDKISPVLLLLTTIHGGNTSATIYLTGYDPQMKLGGPPEITAGRRVVSDNDIVLDESFAAKYDFQLGDTIRINSELLRIVGFSGGTNAFVIQYAFVTLKRAQSLISFKGLVSCMLVTVKNVDKIESVITNLLDDIPGIVIYTQEKFVQNNIKEMEAGILPLFFAVAVIGAIVLTVILSLILSINILENRQDLATMKTLGSPRGFLSGMVIKQALSIVLIALMFSLILFFPITGLVQMLAPEIDTKTYIIHIIYVTFVVIMMGLISSVFSLGRLKAIYPLEVYA